MFSGFSFFFFFFFFGGGGGLVLLFFVFFVCFCFFIEVRTKRKSTINVVEIALSTPNEISKNKY